MKAPTVKECYRILEECGTNAAVIRHCETVAKYAKGLAIRLNAAGHPVDADAVYAAGLLHDCKKAFPKHAAAAAALLAEKGYPDLAEAVASHQDLPHPEKLDEAALLFYADKRIKREAFVTVDERFSLSAEKCVTEEAKAAHKRRLDAAKEVERRILAALLVKAL